MNTFVGRDPAKSIDGNWPRFLEVWKPLVKRAEEEGVRIGIENCPMYFSSDEWPSGKNLAISPALRPEDIPAKRLIELRSRTAWQRMTISSLSRSFLKSSSISMPRTPGSMERLWTMLAFWQRRWSTIRQSCRVWATSIGAAFSASLGKLDTTGLFVSRSKIALTKEPWPVVRALCVKALAFFGIS